MSMMPTLTPPELAVVAAVVAAGGVAALPGVADPVWASADIVRTTASTAVPASVRFIRLVQLLELLREFLRCTSGERDPAALCSGQPEISWLLRVAASPAPRPEDSAVRIS